MPSTEHEAAIELVRLAPHLVTGLLADLFDVDVSACVSATAFAESSRVLEARTLHADAAFVYSDGDGAAVLSVIFEVQRSWDADKRLTWRLYLAHLEHEVRAPAALVVYCPDPRLGARYRAMLADDGISSLLRPLIVTSDDLPLIVDPDIAAREPERVILSALAHHRQADLKPAFPAFDAALAALTATLGIDRAIAYHDVIKVVMQHATYEAWRNHMTTTEIPRVWLSDENQRIHERGWRKGAAEAKAADILKVLEARGFAVPDDLRERILATTDLDRLDTWLGEAVIASTLDDFAA
ncbi:MAG: hypothetical protein QM597_06480 [Aeromicrobium sp.]|uniref:hypothetical protein n=1 Tax=Aeromicrobium sp. TaxID=1871063 RepID=UPI0039E650DB